MEKLQGLLDDLGIRYVMTPTLVRGLDYYTKTVFEIVTDKIGAQGTVCGGGRYDNLVEEIGGPATPGVGFGLGIERLLLLMEANGYEIPEPDPLDVFITVMGDKAKLKGLEIIHKLHLAGISAQMDLMSRNVKGQFKYAARLGARYTVVIGEDELDRGVAQLKDMDAHEQTEVALDDIVNVLKSKTE